MDRATAQVLRQQIVDFGIRTTRGAMTDHQLAIYERARRSSRDVMRHINNVREDVLAPALGGVENVADNYEIDDGDATALATAHHEVQLIAAELGVGVLR